MNNSSSSRFPAQPPVGSVYDDTRGSEEIGPSVIETQTTGEADASFGAMGQGTATAVGTVLPSLSPEAIDAEQFRLLADHLPTLCWMARGDGFIVWFNQRWHDYCGSTPASMEGWGWQSVHDPKVLPDVLVRWTASIATGEPFAMVMPLRGADGRFRPFMTRATPLRDGTGAVVRWFGVNTDIGPQLRAEAARNASEAQYNALTEAMPQMVWSSRADGVPDYFNKQWSDFTGLQAGSTSDGGWDTAVHPDDKPQAQDLWSRSVANGSPFETEYRLRHRSGIYRWTLGRALPVMDEAGRITRWIGTCTDIHAAKLAAEQSEIVNRELSHRIKNIFAIVAGLIRLSARRDPSVAAFARDLLARVTALGRAHDFARPHSDQSRPDMANMMLHGLLGELFRPYVEEGEERITVAGHNVPIDDKGATPLALLFHELATNAAKFGALSVPDGRVTVDVSRTGDTVTLLWRETGGPSITEAPSREGFGTRLTTMSVEQQLGGTLDRRWLPSGLEARITMPSGGLARMEH